MTTQDQTHEAAADATGSTPESRGAPGPTSKPVPRTHWLMLAIIIVLAGLLLWYAGVLRPRPNIAIVAGESPYWDLVVKGAEDAARKYDANLTVVRAKPDVEAQSTRIRELVAGQRLDGIAISPINPAGQAALLFEVASKTPMITMDSDAPISKRLCFVGTDNYAAGRIVGQHVRDALGEGVGGDAGGEVIIAIANVEKDNSIHRRQGLIDELLDRPFAPEHPMDPVQQPAGSKLTGSQFTVVATLIDGGDRDKAVALATEAIKAHPQIKCAIGLNSHNAPALLKALEQSGKRNQVKVVGFDADKETLDGIEAGTVHATIVQDQFGCGFQAVRILVENAHGDASGLPMFQRRTLPVEAVTRTNVAAVRAQLEGKPLPPAPQPPAAAPAASSGGESAR